MSSFCHVPPWRIAVAEASWLFSIHLELTARCNLRCIHCNCNHGSEDRLSTLDVIHLLNEAADLGVFEVTLTGGEPLVREDFLEILQHARQRRFSVSIYSNLTLVDGAMADAIREFSPTAVYVSVYGRRDVHDAITRTPGSYDATIRGLNLLGSRGVRLVIHGQMLSLNSREWPHVLSMAREIGAFFRAWGTQLYPPSWCERAKQERSRPPDAPVIEQFHHLIPATDDVLDMYEALEMTELGLVPAHTNHPRPLDGHLCQAGRSFLSVNALGEVSACEWLPVAGDVHRDSLSELWHASETIAAMREMRVRDLPECAQCDLRRWCEQCPGITVAETGSPTAASPQACRLARARRARYSGVPMV